MSFNHNDADQKGDSYYSSTSGNRGHKRPRNPRKHLATCNNTSPAALSINCECDKLAQDQKQTNGYYESEPDDIDVPLSKRINRLNIENPGPSTSNGHSSSTGLSSINNGRNPMVNSHHETSHDVMSVDNDDLSCTSSLPSYNTSTDFNGRIQTELQPNHINTIAGGEIARGGSYQDPSVAMHNGGGSDINFSSSLNPSSSLPFKERYSYPENSRYYKSNELLNNLFLERQTRQNDS